jgi:hypothetical protein
MAGFGLDPQAAAFARQNYLSGNAELARLDKAHQMNRMAIINRLAAHGLLTSGETGYENSQEDQGYGNNVYDAQQKALADILGYRQGANSQIQNLHAQTLSALQQAYQNYVNNPQLYGTGAPAQNSGQTPVKMAPAKPQTRASVLSILKQMGHI